MSDLSYIKVFLDWTEATRKLTDEEKGRLINAMVLHAKGEPTDNILTGNEAYLFPMFQLQIDRDMQEYENHLKKQRENGAKGGRPKKAEGFQKNPKNPPVSLKTQKSQDKDKEEDKDKDKEELSPLPPLPGGRRVQFRPPDLDDVRAYCAERGGKVDPERFFDYYTSNGWRVGKNPMKDWKAAVRTWERQEIGPPKQGKRGGDTGFQTGNPFLEMLEEERGKA